MSELSRLRVGQGYDVHRLVEGRKLILGGVHITLLGIGPLGPFRCRCLVARYYGRHIGRLFHG